MKKIRCPNCGVINLEGFVTFPNCAGCGALLPLTEKPLPLWRRPVGPLVWASVLGGAILALILLATHAFEHGPDDRSHIMMTVRVPRAVRVGQVFPVAFRVDAISSVEQQYEPLRGVRLRFSRELFRRFAFVSMQPRPDTETDLGSGHYFHFATLPPGARLQLKLRALRLGKQVFTARIHEGNQTTDFYRAQITVQAGAVKRED